MRNAGMNFRHWSVTRWLITVNVVIFILAMMTPIEPNGLNAWQNWAAYSVSAVWDEGQWWRLLTYQFAHANLGHVLFNMVALWIFGQWMETVMSGRKFLSFYLICGIAGALFSSMLASFGLFAHEGMLADWRDVPMVGASGAIYGLLTAAAVLFPRNRIRLLFPPVEMSMRTFAICLLILGVAIIGGGWQNAGGEAGHLGGMFMGFILIKLPWWKPRFFRRY